MALMDEMAISLARTREKIDLIFDGSDGTNHMLREIGKALLEQGRDLAAISTQVLRMKGSLDLMDKDLRGKYSTVSDRLSAIEAQLIAQSRVLNDILIAATKEIAADSIAVTVDQQQIGKVSS